MTSTNELLRVDTEGRVRTPAARREEILNEFERSGASAAAFARIVGVKYPTLANWIQKRRNARREAGEVGATLSWVEATVDKEQAISPLTVQLPCGASMVVSDAQQAKLAGELLRTIFGGGATC